MNEAISSIMVMIMAWIWTRNEASNDVYCSVFWTVFYPTVDQ